MKTTWPLVIFRTSSNHNYQDVLHGQTVEVQDFKMLYSFSHVVV